MSTAISLEDGRVLGLSNGAFDMLLECVVEQLQSRPPPLPGLTEWLLDQRCEVQGPGVGAVDLREMSPVARQQFRAACRAIREGGPKQARDGTSPEWLVEVFDELGAMWASMDEGEPPEARTSSDWKVGPPSGDRLGPGWELSSE